MKKWERKSTLVIEQYTSSIVQYNNNSIIKVGDQKP